MYDMKECIDCGFYDTDIGCCTCPSYDAWYACPIESEKPENIQALKEYAEWAKEMEAEHHSSEIPNNSDTIYRQALINALHYFFKEGFNEDRWWNSTHVLAAIEGVPSVEPERAMRFADADYPDQK